MNKALIVQRFTRAASQYASQAIVQQQIVELLLDSIIHYNAGEPRRILEIGCGPGNYTRSLLNVYPHAEYILNDLCPTMEQSLQDILTHQVTFYGGDAEAWDLPQEIDLLTSASTFQWFHDLKLFLHKASKSLNDNGLLAFSTFGMHNMHEINSLTGSGLSYLSSSALQEMLLKDYEVLLVSEDHIQLHFSNAMEVLHHLKNTGVTGVSKYRWTPKSIRQFCSDYETQFMDSKGVYLTYHPVFVIARKRN